MEKNNNKNKYSRQIKYRKNNYRQFNIDFKNEVFDKFVALCKKNNTTPTTEIKRFVDEYINNNLQFTHYFEIII